MPYYKEYQDNYRIQNRDRLRAYSKYFRKKNSPRVLTDEEKAKRKDYMRVYNKVNSAALNENKKKRIAAKSEDDKERIRQKKRAWAANNKEWTATYHRNRKQTDLAHKLKCYLRTRLYQVLNRNKDKSALELLGCTVEQFKIFIAFKFTEGMSWDNYGEWELDHIKPLSLFDLVDKIEQAKAFHFTNFQPLWMMDNRRKRNTYKDAA